MRAARAPCFIPLVAAALAWAQPTVGPASLVTPSAREGQRQARLAAGSAGFLAVWEAGVGGHSRVRAARLGLDGVSLDAAGLTLASAPGGQFEPAVAFGHGEYYVVWSDMRAGDHVLYGSRVDEQGQLLDGAGVPLSTEPDAARMADVAATPDGFIVVWAQYEAASLGYTARALRLGAGGLPLDAAPIHLSTAAPWTSGEDFRHWALDWPQSQHPRVAVQGTLATVTWTGGVRPTQGFQLCRAFVDLTDGSQPRPSAPAVIGQSRLYRAAVAPFGTGFLVSWTDRRDRGDLGLPTDNVVLMDQDGGVGSFPLQDTVAARVVWAPAVAPNGVVAFLSPVANAQRRNRTEYHLVVRAVLPDGGSPGPDVVPELDAAWPALAVHSSGATVLVYTLINSATDNGALFSRAVTP